MSNEELIERAKDAAQAVLIEVGPDASPERIAAMSWLDGYGAGHQDMTRFAIASMGGDES